MDHLSGRHARHTDDRKVLESSGTLKLSGVNYNWRTTNNGLADETKIINSSGKELLILTADGMRFRSPVGAHSPDGKCYFLKTYYLGGHTTLDLNPLLENDLVTREQLIEIENKIAKQRVDSITGQFIMNEAVIEFRYAVECTHIDFMPEGIWIPYLGIHLFKSDIANHNKVHYGRSRYAEVLLETAKTINEEGVPQAAGCAAVYVTNSRNTTAPVIVANRYYQGVLYPSYDEARPPGIYIVQTNERRTLDNELVRNYVYFPLNQFVENSIFKTREEFESYMKEVDRKTQGKELSSMLSRFGLLVEGFEKIPDLNSKESSKSNTKSDSNNDPILKDPFEWLNIVEAMQSKILSIMKAR